MLGVLAGFRINSMPKSAGTVESGASKPKLTSYDGAMDIEYYKLQRIKLIYSRKHVSNKNKSKSNLTPHSNQDMTLQYNNTKTQAQRT